MVLSITGMTCASCVSTIEAALLSQPGVKLAAVNLVTTKAKIVYDPSKIGIRDLIATVDNIGYSASLAPKVSEGHGFCNKT